MKNIITLAVLLASAVASAATDAELGALAGKIDAYKSANPRARDREIAAGLGISEAEFNLVTRGAVRLRDGKETAVAILMREHELGEVTSLTRNESVVLEVTATADKPIPGKDGGKSPAESAGLFVGPIDLRARFSEWTYAFAVVVPGKKAGETYRSFRFFDSHGVAVHKIIVGESGAAAFDKLVAEFRAPDQRIDLKPTAATPEPAAKPDSEVDVAALTAGWDKLTDAHQFGRLVKKAGATREQALRLAGKTRAESLDLKSVRLLFDGVAAKKAEVLAFVSNDGLTQIYTGGFEKTAAAGGWYNVLDPKLNIHLQEKDVASVWLVRKPVAKGGTLTDVEFFDASGNLIIQFYGKRPRGGEEPTVWRDLVESLPRR